MPGWAPTRRRNGLDPHREKSLLNNSTPKAWQRTDASLTDPWLAEAWRHTPCSSANPPAELRAAILHGAREAMHGPLLHAWRIEVDGTTVECPPPAWAVG